jgi:hypothetical protein
MGRGEASCRQRVGRLTAVGRAAIDDLVSLRTMFPVTGNRRPLGNLVLRASDLIMQAERLLADSLGQGWGVRRFDEPVRGQGTLQPDAILSITAPDGGNALQMVEARQRVFPRDVRAWLRALSSAPPDSTYLLVTPFLSPRARTLLEEAGVTTWT